MKMLGSEKLLTAQNLPLKFYLDGFDVQAFLKTAFIIKEHGGKVSIPDYETIVLSLPHQIPGTQFLTFEVDWLHDSIKKNKLQDLGKYLIPSEETRGPEEALVDVIEPANDDDETKSMEKLLQKDRDQKQPVQNEIPEENEKVPSRVNTQRKRKSHYGTRQSLLKKKKLQSDEEESAIDNTKHKVRWSHHDDEKLLRYLIDNDSVDKYRNDSLWKQIENAKIFEPPRSAVDTKEHFCKTIMPYRKKYIEDPEILKKLENAKRRKK